MLSEFVIIFLCASAPPRLCENFVYEPGVSLRVIFNHVSFKLSSFSAKSNGCAAA
jgi:hypothetical protein